MHAGIAAALAVSMGSFSLNEDFDDGRIDRNISNNMNPLKISPKLRQIPMTLCACSIVGMELPIDDCAGGMLRYQDVFVLQELLCGLCLLVVNPSQT